MRISRELLNDVIAHARDDAPNECCGMIASRDGEAVSVHRATNVAEDPVKLYVIDGEQQYKIQTEIENAGLQLGAIYHSHPASEPKPSATDIRLAFYPDSLYVIVGFEENGAPDVRAFNIVKGQVSSAELEVVS
jgi:[CysO sulfur-carrier protein]-S-L-cysteine hydrolase